MCRAPCATSISPPAAAPSPVLPVRSARARSEVLRALAGLAADATGEVTSRAGVFRCARCRRHARQGAVHFRGSRRRRHLPAARRRRELGRDAARRAFAGSAFSIRSGCAPRRARLLRRSVSTCAAALARGRTQRRQSAEAGFRPLDRRRRRGVLLMNEPTRGVDVGARAEIYRLIRNSATSAMPS